MKPYHTDLRKRIVDAYEKAEGSVRELAVRFKVRPGTVQDYLNPSPLGRNGPPLLARNGPGVDRRSVT